MRPGSIVIPAVVLLEVVLVIIIISLYGATDEALQAIARYSGRISLIVFSVIFLFRYRPGNIDVRLLAKPYHVFAVVHVSHLLFLMIHFLTTETGPAVIQLAGGLAGGVFSILMPLAVRWHDLKRMTVRAFKNLELVFHYFLWLTFFMNFYARVNGTLPRLGGAYLESVILLGWVSLMLGMKVTSLLRLKPFTSR